MSKKSRRNLVKEQSLFCIPVRGETLQLNSKRINVYMSACACVCWGPLGPVLMSYLCAFLTRARCSAHGTVILGRGWPCSAARLWRLLYLWHQHHLGECLCVSMHIHRSVFQEDGSAGGLTREANTVYISIMNQVAEREENTERRKREGGMEEWMEKAISPLLFLLPWQPTPVATIPSIHIFPFCHPYFPSIFAWLDQSAKTLTWSIKMLPPPLFAVWTQNRKLNS